MSKKRALLFDVGNTRLKWGYAIGDNLHRTGSIPHDELAEADLELLKKQLPQNIDHVLASNMAGAEFGVLLSAAVRQHCGLSTKFARSSTSTCGVTNSYRQPRRLGMDRWAGMIGARNEFRTALCIVDAGTAVTIDALDDTGRHLGGQILPGFSLMNAVLHKYTSGLPDVRRGQARSDEAMKAFAKSTGNAIYQGVLGSIVGSVDRAMRRLRKAGYKPTFVLTGGDASRILEEIDAPVVHRPHLVLQGLLVMSLSKG